MNAILEKKFIRIESTRKQLMDMLEEQSEEKILASPAQDKWSIGQILNHLIMSEYGSLMYLKKKNQADKLPKAGLPAFFRYLLLKLVLSGSFKFKAPKVVAFPQNKNLRENFEEWDRVRNEVKDFLESYDDSRLNCEIYNHPIVGRLTIADTLGFFDLHVRHHKKQIRNLIK